MRRTELDPSSSPAAAFGLQLRRSREIRNLSQVQLGDLMGYSDTLISCIERATRSPTADFAARADEALATGGTLGLMWWSLKNQSLLEGFPEYAAEEAKAVEIRLFELGIVPGLLQTSAYARAVAQAAVKRGAITQAQADERMDFLAARQRLFDQSKPPLLHVVLDESCIRRPIGGREVMAAQLDHLVELSDRPNVTLQLAPYSLGEIVPFYMSVTLLTMADRSVLAYTESQHRGILTREIETVRPWERDYHRLQVEAHGTSASVAKISRLRKEDHGP
ncbi:helix-turn-helix transcriptional regulator [Kitasatospora sp. NA04385]|uniref:helix-turn-helix domain-containing protein n=1 Tax=Kitasatospora sp. NA04385 TaxID=2742135 RepID=UPI00158F9F28|nr:helix-turn-helix transcriptional regulator [Kitasatospora sp. NA04385]QKW22436.1 helix-turn-helix transcriptional regulator [Kitasatospora sp. NA04385]